MRRVIKRQVSKQAYEYVFSKDSGRKLQEVYGLVFEEMENNKGVFSFKFQKYEDKK